MHIGDRLILGVPVRDHIGGRWAISLIAYAVNAPLNLLGNLSTIVDARTAPLGIWLIIWSLGYAALGLVLLAANGTVFRRRRVEPVPVAWVIALGALAGGVRGLVVGLTADRLGVVDAAATPLVTRVATSALIAALLTPVAALLLSTIAESLSRRRTILAGLVERERERMQAEGETERLRELLLEELDRRAAEAASDDGVRAARDLSHALWKEASPRIESAPPAQRWRTAFTETFTDYPYPGIILAVLWSAGAVASVTAANGLVRGLLQVFVCALAIVGSFALASRIRPESRVARIAILVATLVVVDLVTSLVAPIFFNVRPSGSGTAQMVANAIWVPVLAIIIGVMARAVQTREQALARLSRELRQEEVAALAAQEELARMRREVAEALHGVQSRVLSARAAGDTSQFSLSDVLGSPWATDPDVRLARTLETWGLMLELHISEMPADLTDDQRRDIARVLDEACANAHRHGRARTCWIAVKREADDIVVTVDDDGSGVTAASAPGLGSGLFASISRDDWSLAARPEGGAALIVRLS